MKLVAVGEPVWMTDMMDGFLQGFWQGFTVDYLMEFNVGNLQ